MRIFPLRIRLEQEARELAFAGVENAGNAEAARLQQETEAAKNQKKTEAVDQDQKEEQKPQEKNEQSDVADRIENGPEKTSKEFNDAMRLQGETMEKREDQRMSALEARLAKDQTDAKELRKRAGSSKNTDEDMNGLKDGLTLMMTPDAHAEEPVADSPDAKTPAAKTKPETEAKPDAPKSAADQAKQETLGADTDAGTQVENLQRQQQDKSRQDKLAA